MSDTVLVGLVYQICELYINDELIHDRDLESCLHYVRKVFERLREFNVAVVSVPDALSRLYENNMPAGAITSPDRRGEEHIDVG